MASLQALTSRTDLLFWYTFGPGNPTSAAQGIGYVQELVARLTQTPLIDFNSTTNNQTLDDNNVTFPLNQPIYVDATHDAVLSMSKTTQIIPLCFVPEADGDTQSLLR